MQQNNITILSTRPLDKESVAAANANGIAVDEISFIETTSNLSTETVEIIKAVIYSDASVVFTSMNAVEAVATQLHDAQPEWDVYSIGNTTKILINKYFPKATIQADAESALALADKIIEAKKTYNVIFFCGDNRRDELPQKLAENNIIVTEVEVYNTIQTNHTINKTYDGILFFSPSAVESFFKTNTLTPATTIFAIGSTTATTAKQFSSNKIIVSDVASKDKLLDKAIQVLTNIIHQ
ncbi:uroporphyrinogen-III synthase [Ferruginibacter sp. SUN002]|uniref:uroporphyrinogen-III synthase n=1 Tax=Ferruginibacter sp. SUN002 TaxID=2937789 RepID=UPI003D35F457